MSVIENEQMYGSYDDERSEQSECPPAAPDKIGKTALDVSQKSGEVDELSDLRRTVLTFLEKKDGYKRAIQQAYGDTAGTFDFKLNKAERLEGAKTFQVSIFRPEIWKLPLEEVAELVCKTCKAYSIDPNNVYLGLWPNREADTELEISFNIPRECAKTVGELLTTFNQEGALDWSGVFEHGVNCDLSFIKNPYYDKGAVVDYEKILHEIGERCG